jgi:hypothetical protein
MNFKYSKRFRFAPSFNNEIPEYRSGNERKSFFCASLHVGMQGGKVDEATMFDEISTLVLTLLSKAFSEYMDFIPAQIQIKNQGRSSSDWN